MTINCGEGKIKPEWCFWNLMSVNKISELKTNCNENKAKSCELLSDLYMKDGDGQKNEYWEGLSSLMPPKEGIRLYTKSCNLGSDSACVKLAKIYKASNVYRKECKFCESIRVNITDNIPDKLQALFVFIQSCEHKNAASCEVVAYMYDEGVGVKKNTNESIRYFEKACELNKATSCMRLSKLFENGDGVQKDNKKSKLFIEKACKLNFAPACRQKDLLQNMDN